MKTIYHAITEIYRPKVETGFPGQVEEGQYTFEDGVVTLIDLATGAPLRAKKWHCVFQKTESGRRARRDCSQTD